jgi:hypothetical protein
MSFHKAVHGLSNDQRSRLCRVEQDMAIYSYGYIFLHARCTVRKDLTRMASKNHDQYLFCELRFWGDAFAPLGEC